MSGRSFKGEPLCRRFGTLVFGLWMVLVWSACASTPRRTEPDVHSGIGVQVGSGSASSRPKVPTGGLTLEAAVALALAGNPDIEAGGWEVEAARARESHAEAGHAPSLDLAAAYRHHWHEERLAPARGSPSGAATSHDILSGDIVLRVPLAPRWAGRP